MVYLAIALLVLAMLFAALYFLQRSQAKRLTKQLEALNKEQRTQIVTMSFPSRVNQNLVQEINRFCWTSRRRSGTGAQRNSGCKR